MTPRRRARIRRELAAINDQINDLYWTFTRTARGKPPCLVRPDLYVRQRQLLNELADSRKAATGRRSR